MSQTWWEWMTSGSKSSMTFRRWSRHAGPVALDLAVGHGAEDGARIGHDIAHPGHRERAGGRSPKTSGWMWSATSPPTSGGGSSAGTPTTTRCSQPADRSVPDDGVEGDAAAGQGRSLGEQVEDPHGGVIVAWNPITAGRLVVEEGGSTHGDHPRRTARLLVRRQRRRRRGR